MLSRIIGRETYEIMICDANVLASILRRPLQKRECPLEAHNGACNMKRQYMEKNEPSGTPCHPFVEVVCDNVQNYCPLLSLTATRENDMNRVLQDNH